MENVDKEKLIRAAAAAREKAVAPYSKFQVGAALLAASGEIITGANVESASYGLTCCAERVALFKALTDGKRNFTAIAVVALTLLNLAGTLQSKVLQKAMELLLIGGLIAFSVAALVVGGSPVQPAAAPGGGSFGFAMIFVLLAYGGWNEAAYLTAEMQDRRRNIVRALVIGLVIVTVLYVLLNVSYIKVLGLDGMIRRIVP